MRIGCPVLHHLHRKCSSYTQAMCRCCCGKSEKINFCLMLRITNPCIVYYDRLYAILWIFDDDKLVWLFYAKQIIIHCTNTRFFFFRAHMRTIRYSTYVCVSPRSVFVRPTANLALSLFIRRFCRSSHLRISILDIHDKDECESNYISFYFLW